MNQGEGARGLETALGDAQARGFIGAGPLEPHLQHARAFLAVMGEAPPGRVVDLGSGGGLPALPLACWLGDRPFVLVESRRRRAEFLRRAVASLDLAPRVEVAEGRAEDLAQQLRGAAVVVTARAFGPPGVTAECAAPFLRAGGWLLVSEPPAGSPRDEERWPADGLARLGQAVERRAEHDAATIQVIVQAAPAPAWLPRRAGVAAKRPVF